MLIFELAEVMGEIPVRSSLVAMANTYEIGYCSIISYI